MKKSNEFINESVFNTNLQYKRLENKTKELFFVYLNNGYSLEDFEQALDDLWGSFDRSFMEDDIEEYKDIIHDNNMQLMGIAEKKTEEQAKKMNKFFKLVGLGVVAGYTVKLINQKKKEYERSLNSVAYQNDKQEYLRLKLKRYNSAIVPYYLKTGKIRYVDLSTYAAMVFNTNLTRAGWNQTLADADAYGYRYFVIPYHSFSCPHCIRYQSKLLSRKTVEDVIGIEAEEQSGDILHPNCKCELIPVSSAKEALRLEAIGSDLTDEEKAQISEIRQKVNTLTLEKERLRSELKIARELGYYDLVDEIKPILKQINEQIEELQSELPTLELQKQVVAINRNY